MKQKLNIMSHYRNIFLFLKKIHIIFASAFTRKQQTSENMNYLAIDLGATSGRTVMATFDGRQMQMREFTRFENPQLPLCGHIFWDIAHLYNEIIKALQKASFPAEFQRMLQSCRLEQDSETSSEISRLLGKEV